MPRYYKDHKRGYDLDLELPFLESNGVKYCLGSSDSFILVCMECGEEHFRERPAIPGNCFQGCGPMVPLTFDNREQALKIWEQNGGRITTVQERKQIRLDDEERRPWHWQFGDKTEADFPLGYVKE